MRLILMALLLGCARPDTAAAQWQKPAPTPGWTHGTLSRALPQQGIPAAPSDVTNSVLIAAVGSALGILVGGFTGYSIDRARDVPSEDPGLAGFIYGAGIGSALLSPTLLYLSNDRRGPFSRAVLLSVAGTALGTWALWLWPHEAVVIAIPVIQIGVSVALLR
jgi:hypothetical protein